MKQSMSLLPQLDAFPEAIKHRILTALTLLAEASWYNRLLSPPHNVGHQVSDLLRAGVTLLDCQWLLIAGYITSLPTGSRGRKRTVLGHEHLREGTRVVLTDTGEAELARILGAARSESGHGTNAEQPRTIRRRPPIHYNQETRELFVGETLVLCLPFVGRKMEAIVASFENHGWRQRIPSPFQDLENGKRAQAVRDAVYGLNQLQDPVVIDFHSSQKGAVVWYGIHPRAGQRSCPDPAEI
jgi:hypothetical protein